MGQRVVIRTLPKAFERIKQTGLGVDRWESDYRWVGREFVAPSLGIMTYERIQLHPQVQLALIGNVPHGADIALLAEKAASARQGVIQHRETCLSGYQIGQPPYQTAISVSQDIASRISKLVFRIGPHRCLPRMKHRSALAAEVFEGE
jgi:hypothetical protein